MSIKSLAFCLLALVLAASFLAQVQAHAGHDHDHDHDHEEETPSSVLVLSEENFDETVANNAALLVEFYAPWCGHCRALAPEYDQAAEDLKKDNLHIAKVDCTVHQQLCGRFGVQGYPTLKLFRGSTANPSDYPGQRSAKAIASYMRKQTGPAVKPLNSAADVKTFTGANEVAVVAFLGDDNDNKLAGEIFDKVANVLRDNYVFGSVFNLPEVNKKYEVTATPHLVVFRKFDEPRVVYEGDFDFDKIFSFVEKSSVPLVAEITPENYQKFVSTGIPLVWIFADLSDKATLNNAIEQARSVAKNNQGTVSFVYLDGVKFANYAKTFGITTLPGICLEETTNKGRKYKFDGKITTANLKEFVAKYVKGELEQFLRSEPIPESNDGPVKVVVGKTFESIVRDDAKDVLVEFYAPWCGHCQRLAPVYEKLGESFKSESGIVIAKVDATENDTPVQVEGFPTLKLFAAGNKDEPIDFNGDRTLEGMRDFLYQHATTLRGKRAPDAEEDEDDDPKDKDEL